MSEAMTRPVDGAKLLERRIRSRAEGFHAAVADLPVVNDALANGQQFNAYDSASNGEDEPDADCEMLICIGPITNARVICRVTGRAQANMIADALTLAALLRARALSPQPGDDHDR